MRPMTSLAGPALCAGLAALALAGSGSASAGPGTTVIVPKGKPVQIAIVLDRSSVIGDQLGKSIHNAIRMATRLTPRIHGFRVQLNDSFDAPCASSTGDVVALNADTAAKVVANEQNVAVIGHMCSYAFGAADQNGCPNPAPTTALSIYESHGIATINGSATAACLPTVGPTVFNRTAVADPDFASWYDTVKGLPGDTFWKQLYEVAFGSPATDFADLYFDATLVLLHDLRRASRLDNGRLIVDRAALARAVRQTAGLPGATCTISLDPSTGNRINDLSPCMR